MNPSLVPLSEATELLTDGTHYTPPDVGSGIPFLTVKDVSEDGLDFVGCSKISPEEYELAKKQNSAPRRGDVLFSKDGTVGKVHLVRDDRPFAVLSSLAILRPTKNVDAGYLAHFLRAPSTIDAALKKKTGSAIRRIILRDLATLEIFLPPLDEQRRIAAVLDKADHLRRKRKFAIELLDVLTQSIFLDMFRDLLGAVEGVPLAEVFDFKNGVNFSAADRGDGIPVVDVLNMYSEDVFVSTHRLYRVNLSLRDDMVLLPGDLLFVRSSVKREGVGWAALFRGSDEPMTHCGFIIRARSKTTDRRYSPHFLVHYLRLPEVRARLISSAGQVGITNINQDRLGRIRVPNVEIDRQNLFEMRAKKIEALSSQYRMQASQLEANFSSLRARVFPGQL